MNQAVIYIRVSSDSQVEGTSLDFQEQQCRKFCTERDFAVAEVFREEGESAKSLSLNNRAEFLRALEHCRKNKNTVTAFVVLRVDRFARNTEDHFAVRKQLLDYGVTLHSVTEPIGNSPTEKMIETVLAAAAEFDNAIRKQRSCDGMNSKINQGIWPWKTPLGYTCQQFKKQGLKKLAPDEPDPTTFPLIQRIFKTVLEEGETRSSQLAILATGWGLKLPSGKPIRPQKIDYFLQNKFYAGVLTNPFTKTEVTGLHIPMVSLEEFERVQALRKRGTYGLPKVRSRINADFPLTNVVLCESCGHKLTGSKSKGRQGVYYAYYHCRIKDCSLYGKAIRKKELESAFEELLSEITPAPQFLDLFREIVIDVWREQSSLLEQTVQQHEDTLNALKEKKLDYVEMIRKGTIDEAFGKQLIEGVDNEMLSSKISVSESSIDKLDIEAAVTYATSFIADLPRQWRDSGVEARQKFQQFVLPEGIPYSRATGLGTPRLPIVYELNRRVQLEETNLVAPTGVEPVYPP